MNTKKLAIMAILTTAALIIFIIEAQIPLPLPIPGAKLGLANAVTLFALFYTRKDGSRALKLSNSNVFAILICRIFLGIIFTGRVLTLLLSFSGGVFAFAAMVMIKRVITNKQIWVCGALAAILHNIGQILAAMVLMGTMAVAAYLPVLIIAGAISGTITGLAAQFTIMRLGKVNLSM